MHYYYYYCSASNIERIVLAAKETRTPPSQEEHWPMTFKREAKLIRIFASTHLFISELFLPLHFASSRRHGEFTLNKMSHKAVATFILSYFHHHRNSSSVSSPMMEMVQSHVTWGWNFLSLHNNNRSNFTKHTIDYLNGDEKGSSYNLFNYYIFLCTLWLLTSLSSKLSVLNVLKPICEIFILNTTLIICLPVILVFNVSVSMTRLIIRLYLKAVHRGKILLMNSSDAFWSIEEEGQTCNFLVFFVIQGACNIEVIRQKFTKLINNPVYDKMRRVVIKKYGYLCWQKVDKMDVSQHVKYLSKSRMSATQIFDKVCEYNDHVFKQDKPPWEVLVVPKFSYDDIDEDDACEKQYALVFVMHHALMDGVSASQAIRKEIADGDVKLCVDPCAEINVNIWHKIGGYLHLVTMGVRTIIRSLTLSESNCFHTGQRLKGPKSVGWSKKIDLNRLKELKNKTGSTTTAVLLNAFAGALKNLAEKKNLTLPSRMHAAPTVALLPYPDTRPQNRFILAHLTIQNMENRVQRLTHVHGAVRNLAYSSDLIMNKSMLWLVGRWPLLIQRIFFSFIHATFLVSNVPGFKEETKIFGGTLVDAVGWPPLKGTTGIGMCLFSYNGQLRVAIIADKVALPRESSVKELIGEFESEIDMLMNEFDC